MIFLKKIFLITAHQNNIKTLKNINFKQFLFLFFKTQIEPYFQSYPSI
jgi:hypothetical protein